MRARSYRTLLFLGALVAAALLAVPGVRAADDAVITGQVIGKNGASDLGAARVTLAIGTTTGGNPQERTAQVGADGTFRFDGFPFDQSAIYLLAVVYDGGKYFREVQFPDGQTSADVGTITIYPTGRDASAISVPRLNTIVSTFDPNGSAQGIETGAYNNASDRAYIGPAGTQNAGTLRFGLPDGASGIEPAQGLNRNTLVPLSDTDQAGFATIEAIPPGEQQFAFIYRLPTQNDTLNLDRVFPYPTGLYSLYLPANARLASGGQEIGLRDSGEQTLQNGQKFRVFTANNIPAGGHLTARFTGLPSPGTEVNPLIPAMIVFTLLVGLGLLVAYGRKRGPSAAVSAAKRQIKTVPGNAARARPLAPVSNGEAVPPADAAPARTPRTVQPAEDPVARKERLLLELVELDERHDAGDLSDEDYRAQRQRRKDELVATLRDLELAGAGGTRRS